MEFLAHQYEGENEVVVTISQIQGIILLEASIFPSSPAEATPATRGSRVHQKLTNTGRHARRGSEEGKGGTDSGSVRGEEITFCCVNVLA